MWVGCGAYELSVLIYLVNERGVSAFRQNQAKSALLFLYKDVLTQREVAALLHGTGALLEGLRLRVKDVGFTRREVIVREGKGGKDRVTVLPEHLIEPLQVQIVRARALHVVDLAAGRGEVLLRLPTSP